MCVWEGGGVDRLSPPVNSSEFLVYKEVVRDVKNNTGMCTLSKLKKVWM